jgi:hypothetical protein
LVREWAQRSDPVNILYSDEPLAAVRTDKGRDLSLVDTAADCCGVNAQSPTSVSEGEKLIDHKAPPFVSGRLPRSACVERSI